MNYCAAYVWVEYQGEPGSASIYGSTYSFPEPGAHPTFSIIGATNTVTSKVTWSIRIDTLDVSSMAVAGDLLFYGEDTGQFHAVDAGTGVPPRCGRSTPPARPAPEARGNTVHLRDARPRIRGRGLRRQLPAPRCSEWVIT